MFRIKIAMIIGGLFLAYWGIQQFRVSAGTSSEPVAVKLHEIEEDGRPENNYLQLGEHVAIYAASVYEYKESKFGGGDLDSCEVTHCFYPVISDEHSFL